MKGAYILMESLLKENVDTIFGYPGGSIMPTFDALYDYMDKFRSEEHTSELQSLY